MPLANHPEFHRLLVFGFVGALNTAVCYALYAALIQVLGWNHNLALVADYAFGAVLGFVAHRIATFSDRAHVKRAFSKYLTALMVLFALNLAVLDGIVESGLLEPMGAQLVAMLLVTAVSYVLQRQWVFRSHDDEARTLAPSLSIERRRAA